MKKKKEFKVVVVNPLTEEDKEKIMKRVEDYLTTVYTPVNSEQK